MGSEVKPERSGKKGDDGEMREESGGKQQI